VRLALGPALLAAACLPAPAAGQHAPASRSVGVGTDPSSDPVGATGAAAWRADIAAFGRELAARHGDIYHTVDSVAFAEALKDLAARAPDLARHELIVGLVRIAASVGDGHTSVPFLFDDAAGLRPVPLRFQHFEEGVYVRGAGPGLSGLAGARLAGVGEVPIDSAWEALAPLVARDNDIWLRVVVPTLLGFPEILHAVGLTPDPSRVEYRFVTADGAFSRVVEAGEPRVPRHGSDALPQGWTDARPPGAWKLPAALAPRPDPYWSAYLDADATLYIRFDEVNDAPEGPGVVAFFRDAFRDADARGVRRVILDIRANSGGEGMLNYPIVREVLSRPALNRPGGVYVIIGRRTFSAAQALAHMFDLWTEAVFVGEPTGSSPQFWGDHDFFRLPYSDLLVSASPTWWQPGGPYDRRPWLPPAWTFEPRFEDYVAGRDPALSAILDGALVALDARVAEARRSDRDGAVEAAVRAWLADPVNRHARATGELNRLGYALYRDGAVEDALAVFRLNVEIHPEYANGWDSLGEVLLAEGRTEAGLEAYERAYALDRQVGRAAQVLSAHGR
jgi:hypothetical protein